MDLQHLTFNVANQIATITLNRPNDANALSLRMAQDLHVVANHCDASADIRAVILTATGKMFCAGGDVLSFAAAGDGVNEMMRNMTTYLHGAIARFQRMNPPLIIACNGTAAGAGLSIMLMGDIVVAASSAKFTMAYTGIGVSPDGSSSFFLPRIVGTLKAKEMMLLNPRYSADEAKSLGLVTEVVVDDQVLPRAQAIAAQLAAGPTLAYGEVKRLLADTFSNGLETQMELETRAIAGLTRYTRDAREGIQAFSEKRKPQFEGR
ncbi:MAG: enoyl-CoA hydratase/isomerase family protein [Gammaproteobacteria bacterium]|nr:enoyl-CoA hydratase/isomerase family protein [Gammaproteobacteria bacterium]